VPTVSIVCATHRPDPHFDWLLDGLSAQLGDSAGEVELVVVDGLHGPERTELLTAEVAGRFALTHVAPKPTPWNGTHGIPLNEYYAPASARNSGIVHASGAYIVFQDDCSMLAPDWWSEVKAAAAAAEVVTGACHTLWELPRGGAAGTEGYLEPDRRWHLGDDRRWTAVGGGNLAGASFGAPRELLLAVGGFDELCDPVGFEDNHLGARLEWAGAAVHFSRRMLSTRAGERHRRDVVRRLDRVIDHEPYMSTLRSFGVTRRVYDGEWNCSHLVWDILFGTRETSSIGNHYVLGALRGDDLPQTAEQMPLEHWIDGSPIGRL
jgi:hypothetical protein